MRGYDETVARLYERALWKRRDARRDHGPHATMVHSVLATNRSVSLLSNWVKREPRSRRHRARKSGRTRAQNAAARRAIVPFRTSCRSLMLASPSDGSETT